MLQVFPILAGLSLGVGPILFARSFRDFKVKRLIENTPTARIRSMAMGLVEICGTIVGRSTVRAPFSGQACAYWQVDIATQGGRNQWRIIHRNASGNPFYVEDETGVALLYPAGAECKVRFGRQEECTGIGLPECYSQYMSEQGLAMRHMWRLGALRFRERTLEEGQRIYVLGTATPRPSSHPVSFDDEPAKDPEARFQKLDSKTVAVVRRGESEPTFILSQESERELVLRLGLRAVGSLIAGPALTLLGLGYWLDALSTKTMPR